MDDIALLTFCRWVIGLTFAVSAGGKAIALPAFRDAISDLGMVPRWGKGAVSVAAVGTEGLVVALVAAGGMLAGAGFALAITLLGLFSAVLAVNLRRRIEVNCNCFGPGERRISWYDVARNVLLGMCCAGGLWASIVSSREHLPPAGILALGLMAGGFTILATNLQAIIELLRRPYLFR
jgi:Methylamine utilisation protein MauE